MQATLIPYLPRDMTLCLSPTPRSPNDSSTVNQHSRHCLPKSGSINRQAMKRQPEECDACPDQMTVPCRPAGSRMHHTISPLILTESNVCCNCNVTLNKLAPAAAESETMPRLPRSGFACPIERNTCGRGRETRETGTCP